MGRSRRICRTMACGLVMVIQAGALAQGTRDTTTYRRIKAELDATPAIDTHDHLWPFDRLPGMVETDRGKGMNLSGLWRNSYYTSINPLTAWTPGMTFEAWWSKAKHDFDAARATSFYRYQLPAFTDLYGIDFDRITDDQARDAQRPDLRHTTRTPSGCTTSSRSGANIELMFNDPYWARLEFHTDYPVRGPGLQRHDAGLGVPPLRVQAARRRPLPLRPQARA